MEEDPCMHFDMGHTMMSTSFHFGYCENVLFDTWKIRNEGSLVGSMFGIMAMAILYEGLKSLREHLFWKESLKKVENLTPIRKLIFGSPHLVQTGLHVVQVMLSYFLMLIVMYYNAWLFISVVCGSTIGYYVFGWRKLNMLQQESSRAKCNCKEKS
ncbi:high affinity copper uptake protein 1-like [Neocloeon triangulifer]|uniref:high affinity copper uptake protein 1-like n=1 Tax=Neocloeon triangulifer TaxID=2078957 RepID=UPI00286EDF78|nr:high affinity copper uptake protein 1-like [Neocloeon triangulifer]